ncbi:MAG: diadenylate cyclase CdaA [bacterium]
MEMIKMIWFNYLIHVLDVCITAFVIYRLIILFKGTRAMQVLLGIIMLAISTLIIYAFHFRALGFLVEKFWLAGVVILVVVFQPELRAALAHLGSGPMGKLIVPEEYGFIKDIVDAVRIFVEKNVGALIVLQQKTGLRNFLETGTVINGIVSKELLLTIFSPRSAMHDGAVIIQDARLIAAGCLLPLSQNSSLSKILGTRHRSAVGLTEISDAIVIVVSEETGMVSISKEGKIEMGKDPDKLYDYLMEYYRSIEKVDLRKKGENSA